MLQRFFKLNLAVIIILFVVANLICTALGMGVPIFNILFGFFIGWYISKRAIILSGSIDNIFKKILIYCSICASFTFIIMVVIWARTIPMLFNPAADFENFGIPLILYDPKISFIGWIILMIVISPFLQFISSIFTAYITLTVYFSKTKNLLRRLK